MGRHQQWTDVRYRRLRRRLTSRSIFRHISRQRELLASLHLFRPVKLDMDLNKLITDLGLIKSPLDNIA
jgi:hypothetical protein